VSGADEQQSDTGGRRGWWLVGSLAVIGAALGAFAGHRLDPDVKELAPSLAAVGLGLGGLLGLLLLVPGGVWRAWRRRRARRRAAVPEPADPPDGAGLWHAAETEAAPPDAAEPAEPETEREPSDESGADDSSVVQPEPEPEEPPPPEGEEPGWYVDPRDGQRRYWDGHAWTGHVWRGRTRERTRRTRG